MSADGMNTRHEPAHDVAKALVTQHDLLVCVGPGGVGKTTIAASLGLVAARLGRRTLVLTIDPARRLADALCIEALADEPRRVPFDGPHAPLDAAMLETGASFDALIARIAGSEQARTRILDNAVYKVFSRTLARSHAYVAMERLHDVLERGAYDLVILDTPPLRSALDILDAPERLAAFLDDSVLGHFVRPRAPPDASRRSFAKSAATAGMKLLGVVLGRDLASELTTFLDAFLHLREGFVARARASRDRLRAATTGFVLVTAPEATSIADAVYFAGGLEARGVAVAGVVVNRAFLASPRSATSITGASTWNVEEAARALGAPVALLRTAARHRARLAEANERALRAVAPLFDVLPARTPRLLVRALEADIATRAELEGLLAPSAP